MSAETMLPTAGMPYLFTYSLEEELIRNPDFVGILKRQQSLGCCDAKMLAWYRHSCRVLVAAQDGDATAHESPV